MAVSGTRSSEGGGASITTEQAAGSSAPTDVSLREFVHLQIIALERHMLLEFQAVRQEFRAANSTAEKAVSLATDTQKETLEHHNGLLRQMEKKDETYAKRETVEALQATLEKHIDEVKANIDARLVRIEKFQTMVLAAIGVVGFIGAANLSKWFT